MSDSVSKTQRKAQLTSIPLLVKVMGIALGAAFFLGAVLFWQTQSAYYQLEKLEVEAHANFVAEVLALSTTPLLRDRNTAELQLLLDGMSQVAPEPDTRVKFLQVLDGSGRVVARSSGERLVDSQASLIEKSAKLPGDLPGSVEVALTDSHIGSELDWHRHRIIAATAIIALLGSLATWGLMHLVTRPIRELVQVTRAIKAGNYHARATVRSRDEVGELAGAFNEMIAALQQKDATNHQLLRKIIGAEEEERKRVARELHDQTGQALTSLIASLAALRSSGHTKELTELLALATQTLSDVHDLSRTLRPSALDELGLVPALQRFCECLAKRLGLKVDFAAVGLSENSRLPSPVEVTLYRIGQEALTNAVRHGRARSVEVLLHRKPSSVLVVIEDDGQGFEAANWRERCLRGDHLGLLGIEERAALLGGTLRVESRPGTGTSLFVEIPLAEQPQALALADSRVQMG